MRDASARWFWFSCSPSAPRSASAFAQAPAIQAGGWHHIVQPGDTLVKIATAFYG